MLALRLCYKVHLKLLYFPGELNCFCFPKNGSISLSSLKSSHLVRNYRLSSLFLKEINSLPFSSIIMEKSAINLSSSWRYSFFFWQLLRFFSFSLVSWKTTMVLLWCILVWNLFYLFSLRFTGLSSILESSYLYFLQILYLFHFPSPLLFKIQWNMQNLFILSFLSLNLPSIFSTSLLS